MRCCVAKGRGHKGRLQLHPCAQPVQNRAAKKITNEFTTPDNLTQQSTTFKKPSYQVRLHAKTNLLCSLSTSLHGTSVKLFAPS